MSEPPLIRQVLRHFPHVEPRGIACLHNAGGFSGACLWRITTAEETLCLRKWPPAANRTRLQQTHSLLQHAAAQGMTQLPVPLPSSQEGEASLLKWDGALFELTRWMPGQADFHAAPSERRLTAALQVLADFHASVRSYASPEARQFGPSPGLTLRRTKLQRLLQGEFERLASASASHPDTELGQRAGALVRMFPICAPAVQQLLDQAALRDVPLQYCIGDVWHDHVLFTGDEVTGLIDFGAIRVDHVATDLARLIGSLVGDDPQAWTTALHAYRAHPELTAEEHLLIRAFDHSAVLMSGLNWLQWICVEGRRFEDQRRVLARLDENVRRMEHLCQSAGLGW